MFDSTAPRRDFEILGACFDGGSPSRGPADAPRALRERRLVERLEFLAGLLGLTVRDGGDVAVPPVPEPDSARPRHVPELLDFSRELMGRLGRVLEAGRVPIVIGGDHAVTVPSVSAAAAHLRATGGPDARLGLIYVDAHPDLETPEASPEGDLHGMSVAHLLGYGLDELRDLGGFRPKIRPEDVVFLGLRDVVQCERRIIRDLGLETITMTDLERLGIVEATRRAVARATTGTDGWVLSFDIDACDPLAAPGVHYPEPGGLTVREAAVFMETIAATPGLVLLELVEVVPGRDRDHATANLAVELIRFALGARIV